MKTLVVPFSKIQYLQYRSIPGIAKHVRVGGASSFDLRQAVGDHPLPVLLCQWHCVQLHACLLAYLSRPHRAQVGTHLEASPLHFCLHQDAARKAQNPWHLGCEPFFVHLLHEVSLEYRRSQYYDLPDKSNVRATSCKPAGRWQDPLPKGRRPSSS